MNPTRRPRLAVLSLACASALCTLAVWACHDAADAPLETVAGQDVVATTTDLGPAQGSAAETRSAVLQHSGYYAAPVGASFQYDVTGMFDYSVRHPEGGQQRSGMELQSTLRLLVADRRDAEILVRAELCQLELKALTGGNGSDEGGLAAAAARPFDARLGEDGRVLGYRFAPELNAEQRNFVRGLFATLLHTVPADATGTWEAEDTDAAGVFVARWQLQTQDGTTQVERRKLRYTAMAGNELHPHEITGTSQAVFGRDVRWLRSVDADERTTLTVAELGLVIELRSVLHATLVANGTEAITGAASWDVGFAPAAGHTEDFGNAHEANERARWSKQLDGASVDTVAAELATLLAADPRDPQAIDRAFQAMIWLVKLNPEAAAAIALRVPGMSAELADVLLSALGAAGTEAAQDVLAAMRHDAAISPALRTSATVALFQLSKPGTRVLGDLVADLRDASELSGDHAMGMLLLGALAPRAGDARIGGQSALEALLAFEQKSTAQGRQDLWLNALGNVAAPENVQHVQRYVGHDDERVRGAAYNALRLVDTAPALALLDRGLVDPSAAVRSDVVNALGQHRSATACELLIRTAQQDGDAAVRRATLDGLGSFARSRPAAREAIERMARSDADADNQRAARTVLEGLR